MSIRKELSQRRAPFSAERDRTQLNLAREEKGAGWSYFLILFQLVFLSPTHINPLLSIRKELSQRGAPFSAERQNPIESFTGGKK